MPRQIHKIQLPVAFILDTETSLKPTMLNSAWPCSNVLVKRKETQTLTSVVAGTNILHAPSLSSLRFKREGEKGKS